MPASLLLLLCLGLHATRAMSPSFAQPVALPHSLCLIVSLTLLYTSDHFSHTVLYQQTRRLMSSPRTFAEILSSAVKDGNKKLNLARLNLSDTNLATLASEAKASRLPHVEDVDISKNKLNAAKAKTIAQEILPRL